MSRSLVTFLVVAMLAGIIASCGGKMEETYILTTLREATRGDRLSPGFKYSFSAPNVVAVHKNLAIVREGNILEFFTGQNLEEKMSEAAGRRVTIGARKMFTPRIYFSVDWMTAGMDTIDVGEAFEVKFPVLMRSTEFPTDDFAEVDLDDLSPNTLKLKPIYDSKFFVPAGTVAYEEVLMPNNETKMAFTLNLKNVRFIIDDPGDDLALILKALINENLYFDGGVSFGGRPTSTRSYRDKTKIAGEVKLEFVKYGGHVITVG
jgi:hypothetical protein